MSELGVLIASILAIAMALSPLVVAIVELVKLTWQGVSKRKLPAELVPAVACLVGVLLAYFLIYGTLSQDWRAIGAGGMFAGLIASKLFDAGQAKALPAGSHWNDTS